MFESIDYALVYAALAAVQVFNYSVSHAGEIAAAVALGSITAIVAVLACGSLRSAWNYRGLIRRIG